MAVIYLRHEKHGAKVACSDLEAAYDISNGWERFDPTAPAFPVNAMPKRRGRPPKS